ncbi:MAG: UDP-3-O-(3-hydroxymyristoyl)glucosamine N-acyltransferase [Haliscomenobacteraceae bacterium CHB4]|nr:UDP-3-O-acylglucosamine N-acyltransferase [Saprospiraceae bacterium]MCE7924128.1 UDP-3-O-(3-hydroxymyristoyl)glucosamine N-acyltransferase [Haliscomenobacteraceae bacterium CHB4]
MKVTAAQLAHLLEGSLEGDPNATVSRPARIEEAGEGDFAFLDNPKYEAYAYTTQASILLVNKSFQPSQPVKPTLIRVDDVRSSLAFLLQKFDTENNANGTVISEQAFVHKSAKIGIGTSVGVFTVIEEGAVIGNNCTIYPQVYIGRNARIGEGCRLFPGVRIHFDCVIGDNCTVHANAVIGADGFGFAPQEDKTWKKVPQVGNVVIENDVEIGASTCIDRAAIGSTIIRRGAKLDNLIHIAHNAEVGKNTALAAQVGVAGSTRIGDNCQLGGQVGLAGHLTIADGTRIQAQSGLSSSVETPNSALFGSPAIGYKDFIRSHVVFKHLPDLQKKVLELEKKLKEMGGSE